MTNLFPEENETLRNNLNALSQSITEHNTTLNQLKAQQQEILKLILERNNTNKYS